MMEAMAGLPGSRYPTPKHRGRVRRSATSNPLVAQRIAKYDQLLRIDEELGDPAEFAGATAFPCFQA